MVNTATIDLSSVTDALIVGLNKAITDAPLWVANGGPTAPFTIAVSGIPFDLARGEGGAQLSLALIHVGPSATYRTQMQRGPTGLTAALAPAALTLTYAVSAFAAKDYVQEQQAMGIALSWILANPIQRLTIAAIPPRQVEYTMTLEPAGIDEIARIWQSVTGALRLTVLVRVGVVFLGPDPAAVVPQPKPDQVGMLVTPADLSAGPPALLTASEAVAVANGLSLAPLAPGQTTIVAGLGLGGTDKLFLSPADDSVSFDVTAWVGPRVANTLHLTLPAAAGVPPAGTPAPGLYRLRIGTAAFTAPSIPLEIGA
jgi:hypothetical protein